MITRAAGFDPPSDAAGDNRGGPGRARRDAHASRASPARLADVVRLAYDLAVMQLPSDLWTGRYDPGVPAELELPDLAFTGLVDDAAADAPSLNALEYFGRRLTYAELCAESLRVAAGLERLGIGAGSRVVIALPPCIEWALAHLAVWRAGGVVVAGQPRWRRDDWRRVCQTTSPSLAVVSRRRAADVRRACPELPLVVVDPLSRLSWPLRLVAGLFGGRRAGARRNGNGRATGTSPAMAPPNAPSSSSHALSSASADRHAAPPPVHPAAPLSGRTLSWVSLAAERRPLTADGPVPGAAALLVPRSPVDRPRGDRSLPPADRRPHAAVSPSGDAGRPWQTFTHRHLVAGALQLRAWLADVEPGEATWLITVSSDDALGIVAALGTVPALRARWLITPPGDLGTLLDAVEGARPSHILSDEEALARFASDPALVRLDARSLRVWLAAGAFDAELCRTFEELCDVELCQGFGGSAAAGLVCCNPVNGRRVVGSVGLPLPGIRVYAEGSAAAGGASGLRFAGPNVLCNDPSSATLPDAAGPTPADDVEPGAGWPAAAERRGDSGAATAQLDEAGFVYVSRHARAPWPPVPWSDSA